MLLLLPIRTSIWPRRTPYANYALIALNIIIFLLSYSFERQYAYMIDGNIVSIDGHLLPLPIRPWAMDWILLPGHWQYWQFLSYAFLHGSLVAHHRQHVLSLPVRGQHQRQARATSAMCSST